MPQWRRITDICWVIQTGVGQPSEVGASRFLDDRWLLRDAFAAFNPRHGYTENEINIDLTVPTGYARIVHDFEIADGTSVDIENGAELLIL